MMKNPPMGAILFALEVPDWGGDTLFANQYMAFENLSPGMKKLLMNLKAVHNDSRVAGPAVGLNSKRATKVREDDDWTLTENSTQLSERILKRIKSVCLLTLSMFIILKECRLKRAKTFWNFFIRSQRGPNTVADFAGRITRWRFGIIDVFST